MMSNTATVLQLSENKLMITSSKVNGTPNIENEDQKPLIKHQSVAQSDRKKDVKLMSPTAQSDMQPDCENITEQQANEKPLVPNEDAKRGVKSSNKKKTFRTLKKCDKWKSNFVCSCRSDDSATDDSDSTASSWTSCSCSSSRCGSCYTNDTDTSSDYTSSCCCTEDEFTEYTLTSSSNSEDSDTSTSFSEETEE